MIEDAKKKGLLPADIALLPPGGGWILVEFGSQNKKEAVEQAQRLIEELKQKDNPPDIKLFDDARKAADIWLVREAALGATGRVPGEPDAWPGWKILLCHLIRLAITLRDLRDLLERFGYRWAFYGHFGQGCIHTRISFELDTSEGVQKFRSFIFDAADTRGQVWRFFFRRTR